MHAGLMLILILSNLRGAAVVPAQANYDVRDVTAFYSYGESVTFQAHISPVTGVNEVYLMIQPEGQNTRMEPVTLNVDGEILYKYDLAMHPLRPFGRTFYWFRLATEAGEVTTPSYWFDYIDNRFTWQTLSNQYFDIHWQGTDLTFGQKVMNTAKSALDSAQKILPTAPKLPLKIFVYTNPTDLKSALPGLAENWAVGHASPDLQVILLSIPTGPDQSLELERQLPHEMMHVLEYEIVGNQYANTPVWLTEGIASIAELYPNADYARVLEAALQTDGLLSFQNLCNAFPRDAGSAFLAYAQSTAFVRYVYQNFGSIGLTNLLRQYQTGLGCEEGVQAALGKSLTELENNWRATSLSDNPTGRALKTLSPYLIIALLLLIVPLTIAWIRPRAQEKPA